MKINNTTPPNQLRSSEPSKIGSTAKVESIRDNAQASTTATLTQSSHASSQDIDTARVNEIRAAIREGQLEIRTDKISEGLLESVRSMLSENN